MTQNIEILVLLCLLTVISFIFAFVNIKYLKPFWKHKRLPFIKQRKPILLMLYTVLSSILLFIIIPNICAAIYVHSLHETHGHSVDEWWLTYYFIFDSIHGSIFCTFINIIAIRVWLLFYEHKFAIATVDKIWRNVINPNDNNFFLNRRNTFGNDRFLLKILFTIWIFTVFVMLFIVIMFLLPSSIYAHVDEYLFLALRVCIAFPVSIFIFIIYHKIKEINDDFDLRREMKYLSYLVCFVIFTSCINFILLVFFNIPIYLFEIIVYSFDLIFIFSSNYVQTKWVLNVLVKRLKNPQQIKIKHIPPMIDILRNKNTFEAFMRHCVNELSVESLLFCVEVALYKATLSSYNAPDKRSQHCFIDVQRENVRRILIESGQKRRCTKNKDIADIDEQKYDEILGFGAHPISKQEGIFYEFQRSILNHKWLPISLELSVNPSKSVSFVTPEIASKQFQSIKCQLTPHSTQAMVNKCSSSPITPEMVNKYSSSPISPAMVNKNNSSPITPAMVNKYSSSPISPAIVNKYSSSPITTNNESIRDFALILYNKYIKINSALSINVSSMTRHFLVDLFNKSQIETFEYIVKNSGGDMDENEQCPDAVDEQLLINTYLYHVFDESFQEIWNLLRVNSFIRFTETVQYQEFIKKTHVMEKVDSTEIIYQE